MADLVYAHVGKSLFVQGIKDIIGKIKSHYCRDFQTTIVQIIVQDVFE